MNPYRFVLCLTAGAGLLLSQALVAGEPPLDAAETIRNQGKRALAAIQASQYRDMLARTQAHLMPVHTLIIPSPPPRVGVQIRLQGELALFAIREQLLTKYRTGSAARQLAAQHYRVRVLAAAEQDSQGGTLEQAKALFKSAKFEWPEFLPRGLR